MTNPGKLPNLDKIFRDDDEFDFVPSGGSSLATIFGDQQRTPVDLQSKSRKSEHRINPPTQNAAATKSEVILAKVVHAFKLRNREYISLGNLGVALIANSSGSSVKTFQLILYKTKQEYISVVPISLEFSYVVQPNNYSSYYDTNKENWSILFDSDESCREFSREVFLARYFSSQNKLENSILFQDLSPSEKGEAEMKEGDRVTVRCTVSTDISQASKDVSKPVQIITVEVSTDDNWERSLLGCSKGLQRVLILPPRKQISLGPGFPTERDVLLEIAIVDVESPEKEKQEGAKPSVHSSKAAILSRMTKMGQSILPRMPVSTTTDSEDTEDDIPQKLLRHKRTESVESPEPIAKKPVKSKQQQQQLLPTAIVSPPKSSAVVTPTISSPWPATAIQSHYVAVDGQMYPMQSQTITQAIPAAMDPNLNIFLSESRMQSAELRMGMSKIADNVQKILDKFHAFELQNPATPTNADKTLETTLKMLLNISANKDSKDSESTESAKSNDLSLEGTSKIVSEQTERISNLESELNRMKEMLEDSTRKVERLEEEKRILDRRNFESNEKIQKLEESLSSETERIRENLRSSQCLLNQYKDMNSALENRISRDNADTKLLEEKIVTLNEQIQRSNEEKKRAIKRIMNAIYQSLEDQFDVDDSMFSRNYVKSCVQSTLRETAWKAFADIKGEKVSTSQPDSLPETVSNTVSATETTNANSSSSDISNNSIKTLTSNSAVIPIVETEPPPIPSLDADIVESD